jgi:rSAM/selenodomain-associated transferase 1
VKNVGDPPFVSASQIAQRTCALAIMTKAPVSGQVKTRLTPPLTPAEAAQLNRCFIQDTARILGKVGLGSDGVVCFTPPGAEHLYSTLIPHSFRLLPQRGETLGDRVRSAFEDLFMSGFDAVCLIGSDSPTVPLTTYVRAIEILGSSDNVAVVGPADDGGYYLIGLAEPHPQLFDGVNWSTVRVLDQTLARAAELRLNVEMLPPHYDVDDDESLARLSDELLLDPSAQSKSELAPATAAFLGQLTKRYGTFRN